MIGEDHSLTPGYVARHLPPASKLGTNIAILDIAQDFLLAHLYESGLFDGLVVFKGGTALRKLFAGPSGRFSTDIDLAVGDLGIDRADAATLVGEAAEVTLGPFRFRPDQSRGRWRIAVSSPFGTPSVTMKVDVGPPCWLGPEPRAFVAGTIHDRYGFALPELPSMRLEEVLAEKIARLTRTATARDASDLVWAATTSPHSGYSRAAVRKLAVLKVWVDNLGMDGHWNPAVGARPFDPQEWLRTGRSWDDERIGLLAHPPPRLADLEADLVRLFAWLADLGPTEQQLAACHPRDRAEVVGAIAGLPGAALTPAELWSTH